MATRKPESTYQTKKRLALRLLPYISPDDVDLPTDIFLEMVKDRIASDLDAKLRGEIKAWMKTS